PASLFLLLFLLSALLLSSFFHFLYLFLLSFFFFFTDTAPSEIYTLSLHDALPICALLGDAFVCAGFHLCLQRPANRLVFPVCHRSEEHTSELQSRFDLVCRLLLEKKKKK